MNTKTLLQGSLAVAVIWTAIRLEAAETEVEFDFVAAAISQLNDIRGVGPLATMGSTVRPDAVGLFGWQIRKFDAQVWPVLPSLLLFHLNEALKAKGWTTTRSTLEPRAELSPRQLVFAATSDHRHLEFVIFLFPESDGAVKVAYYQRRTL